MNRIRRRPHTGGDEGRDRCQHSNETSPPHTSPYRCSAGSTMTVGSFLEPGSAPHRLRAKKPGGGPMARRLLLGCAIALGVTFIASPAFACGGLIGPNGAVNLGRTTTLAAYHNGIEHYVTAFTFTGASGGSFGSITPLPGIPTKVERGGSWTLQRLEREVA